MEYFFPDSIRGVIKALIYTFRDIHVKNFDNGPKEVTGDSPRPHKPWAKDIRVPIKFGPRDKIYDTRIEDRYGDGQKYYIILPTCALELTGLVYAPDRQNNINALRYFYDNQSDISQLNKYFEDEMPLSFNMNFTLNFRTDNLSHFTQITEQVLYNFRPNMVIQVKEFSFLNLERDLNVILNNVNQSFSQEITEEQQRTIEFSFDLSVHGFIYSPIELEALIKEIKTSAYFIQPDDTIDLNGTGWLSRTSPKPQDDYGLTPWEAQTGNQSDDSTFRTINDGSEGNQAEVQITQNSTYYGNGPQLVGINREVLMYSRLPVH